METRLGFQDLTEIYLPSRRKAGCRMLPTFLPPPPPAIFAQALISFHTIAPTSLFFPPSFGLAQAPSQRCRVRQARPLPSACARRRRRRLASSGRLPSDWLEAPGVMGDGCSRAPQPNRAEPGLQSAKGKRCRLPSLHPPSFIVFGDSSSNSFSAARGRREEEAAAVPPAGSLWPLRCLPPKGGAVRTNEPNRGRLLLAAATLPPLPAAGCSGCAAANAFPSLRRSPQSLGGALRSIPAD